MRDHGHGRARAGDCSDEIPGCSVPSWQLGPEGAGVVLYAADAARFAAHRVFSLLAPSERAAADRFARTEVRARFVARRAFQRLVVRTTLGLDCPLPAVPLSHSRSGRPYVSGEPALGLSFSSSVNLLFGAVTTSGDIGIDVEALRPVPEAEQLVRTRMRPEETLCFASAPTDSRAGLFLQLWTAKEACLKAMGYGLQLGLAAFGIDTGPRLAVRNAPPGCGEPDEWHLCALDLLPGMIGTVAVHVVEPARKPISLR